MNQAFLYQLDAKGKKEICPSCGDKRRTWRRYINTKTSEILPEQYGICDRLHECGHRYTPAQGNQYGQPSWQRTQNPAPPPKPRTRPPAVNVPEDLLVPLWAAWRTSTFARNLATMTNDLGRLDRIAALYGLGAIISGKYNGAAVFVFIDDKVRIRYAQVKMFDKDNHTTATTALHSINNGDRWEAWAKAYGAQDAKQDCLFGAHLLTAYEANTIFVVEAPKTAIMATLALGLPEHSQALWVATGGAGNLTAARCEPLRNRNVVLVPDLDQQEEWTKKAPSLAQAIGAKIKVSTMLTERRAHLGPKADLADLLAMRQKKQEPEPNQDQPPPTNTKTFL